MVKREFEISVLESWPSLVVRNAMTFFSEMLTAVTTPVPARDKYVCMVLACSSCLISD